MVAALILIAVLGVALPGGLLLFARWRVGRPFKDPRTRMDETAKWLADEFGLGYRDRAAVRRAVLGRLGASVDEAMAGPAPLRPELLPPTRALAARVLAGQVASLRWSRRVGAASLALWAAYAGFALFVAVTGFGGNRALSVLFAFYALCGGSRAFTAGVLGPRRIRRNAQRILAGSGAQDAAGSGPPSGPPRSA